MGQTQNQTCTQTDDDGSHVKTPLVTLLIAPLLAGTATAKDSRRSPDLTVSRQVLLVLSGLWGAATKRSVTQVYEENLQSTSGLECL